MLPVRQDGSDAAWFLRFYLRRTVSWLAPFRTHAGKGISEVLEAPGVDVKISARVEEALEAPTDVLVDFTRPHVVKHHALEAINRGVHVVIGTSGLTDGDYREIDSAALSARVGILAAGNFAITAVLLQRLATIAARYVPHWEIIDYAHADKVDAPSGTTRELAYRLAKVGSPQTVHPVDLTQGLKEARGASVSGTQVHSLRLPGFVISAEVIFGMLDERLSIRHDAGSGAIPLCRRNPARDQKGFRFCGG